MIKINIVSGFLGAGKTTFIRKLISEVYSGEKIALIENEFGEIGIDGGFLKNSGVEIKEMNSGCICCSLVGDFGESLKEMADTYNPERIIIEPTGVGKLSDVIAAVKRLDDPNLVPDSAITVVDGTKCKLYVKNFGEFYNNQIENANCILMTRMDKISEEKLTESLSIIKEINPKAPVITTPLNQLSAEKILDALSGTHSLLESLIDEHHHEHHHDEDCCCGEHHHHDEECECGHHHHEHHHNDDCCCGGHHHDADEAFSSWGEETTKIFTKDTLSQILTDLDTGEYGIVLRSKGIVKGENGWLCFDYVPGEYEIRDGSPDYTGRVCVIGSNLAQDLLKKLFCN